MAGRYVRLRCRTTGHQWDASEAAAAAYLATGGCDVARPPRRGSRPLPMKAYRDLARLSKPRPQPPKETP
jgi:hypothetical protein